MKPQHDYTELDEAILRAIGAGANTASLLGQGEVAAISGALSEHDKAPDWRIIDRRLQAMRRKGCITFNSKQGWTLT